MDERLAREVIECLCGERTLYHYYPDKYAVYLLKRLLSKKPRLPITVLRKSRWATLLNRPILKEVIANSGAGCINERALESCFLKCHEPYVLTLGEWGAKRDWSWNQTSRPGKNLVLQLNLSEFWSCQFRKVVQQRPNCFFDCGHPLSEKRAITLAWARLDVDFDTDEVLVEEIQSDLIRYIGRMQRLANTAIRNGNQCFCYFSYEIDAREFLVFSSSFLDAFKKTWQEVMLAASIEFSFDELGVSNLYYHSFETGNVMKNLDYSFPPRSLYTDLPKRFCFENTTDAPKFLKEEKKLKRKLKSIKDGRWFYMAA